MAEWSDIPDQRFEQGRVARGIDVRQVSENIRALAEASRDGDQPPVSGGALDQFITAQTIGSSFGGAVTGLEAVQVINIRGVMRAGTTGSGTRTVSAQLSSNGGVTWGASGTLASGTIPTDGGAEYFEVWVDLVTGAVRGFSQSGLISATLPGGGSGVDAIRFVSTGATGGSGANTHMVVLKAGRVALP
jgi:hypothetical protein